jgi:hypothetical protein
MRFGDKIISLLVLIFISQHLSAQKVPTYYGDIAPILAKNCITCHQPNKAAPFSLLTYEDVTKRGDFIAHVVTTRYMPPWKADISFQHYKNQRSLTEAEINMISSWVKGGMPKGKFKKINQPVAINTVDEKPDLSVSMPEPYTIQSNNTDDYRFFNLPTNLSEDVFVKKIEFINGNKRLVHHSRLMTDTTQKVRSIHGMSANDPGINKFEQYPPVDKFLYGWVPGNFPIEFPDGSGKKLFKGSDIILNIHYAPTSQENQKDKSTINFYFIKEKVEREVYSLAIAEESITNPPFEIPANEKKTFYASFGPLPITIEVLAVLPHMHYIGKNFRAFAVTPDGDMVPLIRINDWDFRWQDTYQFKEPQVIPAGSVILLEALFDNTAANPANPNSPPKTMTYGWNTTSEMMDLVIYYLLPKSTELVKEK